ncbi:MAG: biopolymer transporter ExbD [Gemmataceae bacterium]|nr:biopolymer transporter ExbD [Gemmataceae bacterium]
MSHGPSNDGGNCEPNMIPLLDMVFQLLMFFMMCVNFVTNQVSEDIVLPESMSAVPMDKSETDVLFVNVRPFIAHDFESKGAATLNRLAEKFKEGDPFIIILGEEPMRFNEFRVWLRNQFQTIKRTSKDGKVKTSVILRAHKLTDYDQVYRVMHMCKVEGFRQLKLRAITKTNTQT